MLTWSLAEKSWKITIFDGCLLSLLGIKNKRLKAAWDNNYLMKVLAG
jgi:hypothetical protein